MLEPAFIGFRPLSVTPFKSSRVRSSCVQFYARLVASALAGASGAPKTPFMAPCVVGVNFAAALVEMPFSKFCSAAFPTEVPKAASATFARCSA